MVLAPGSGRFRGDTGQASVVLITMDTLRADRLGSYGYRQARTPVLDTLADEGVLFENAVTAAVLTLPSHATILTGTWPPTHGLRANGHYRLGPAAFTLAEALRARGFRTAAVIGSFVLDSMFGLDQGFDSYDDALPPRGANQTYFAERSADRVTDSALRFLRTARAGRFFLWVHYFDPHVPYAAPAGFREMHPGRPYDAEVSFMDSEIGRLLGGLRELGLKERTLVAAVADHGEGMGDHGENSHGVFLYEEAVRVPLILSFPPHLPSGRRVRAVARTVDVMPTLLELLRIDPAEAAGPVQGESLWPLMAASPDDEKELPARAAYAEAMAPLLLYGWSPLTSIRDAAMKYIEAPQPELYDLAADPAEKNNLAPSRPDLAQAYGSRLKDLTSRATRPGAPAESASPDHETQAKLRSLGYAGGGPGAAAGNAAAPDPKQMVGTLARIDSVYSSFGTGQYDVTVREAESLLKDQPSMAHVRFYLAGALAELDRCPEALEQLNVLLASSPEDTAAMSSVGWCLIKMDRLPEAAKVFDRVLEIFPGHIHAEASLANIAFVAGDYREAARRYKLVLQQEPNHLVAIKALAGLYEGSGRLKEAAVLYAHGAEADPRDVEMWMNLGWVHFRDGRHAEALEALKRAQEIEPSAPELLAAVGDVQLALERVDDARASYEQAIRLAPRLAAAHYGLGLIESRRGDPRRALQLLQTAVSLNPGQAAWREDLARVLAGLGRFADAAGELESYLASGQAPADRREALLRDIQSYRSRTPR